MAPAALAQVLRLLAERFPADRHPRVLVGLAEPDDAAVFELAGEGAIVATTDFFPPIVDEPYAFGAIAAANAMSDVFAMGGEVLLALNLAVFPDDLPPSVIAEIVAGGADKVAEAGGVLAGGHSIYGREPMYGLAVIGHVLPAELLRKGGAVPGDVLLLTKPIGTGLVTTALKNGDASEEHVTEAMRVMSELNRSASRAAIAAGAHAVTDVTGFGLVGHALEMARASGVALSLEVGALPVLPGALGYAASGAAPGGTGRNREAYRSAVVGVERVPESWLDLLFDPQTSGGLLVALPEERVPEFRAHQGEEGAPAAVVGRVLHGRGLELVS